MHIPTNLRNKLRTRNKRKTVDFQKAVHDEVDYPPWSTQKRVLDAVLSLPESMSWNSVLAVLTLIAIVMLSMDYESTEIVFKVRLSQWIDIAYNIMYGIHVVALLLEACYRRVHEKRHFSIWHCFCLGLDVATYLHYLKVLIRKTDKFDFPYVITIVCYYVRMRRSIIFLLGLNDYYLKGSIMGLMLKYWYIFLMVRVIYSNAFVWLGLTEEVVYKLLPPTLRKSRGQLFFRTFYMMDKRFLPLGMDKPADSDLDRAASIIVVVSGSLLVTGVSIASLALLISVYMKFEQTFRARFHLIMDYMIETNVPANLRRKVETFYKMYWHKQKAVSITQLLPTYPPTLINSLNIDIYFEALQKSQILRDLSYEFLSEIAKYMKTIHYMPGDVIIQRKSLKSSIVYISYGDVEMVTAEDDETPILRFTRGSILNPCGACADVACSTAHVSVRAATFCTAHVLRTADVWRVAVKHGHLNGQTYIMHSALDEHLDKVVRHFAQRPHPPMKYKSSIMQLKRNLIELKEARDKDGKLIISRSDKFLQIADCYIMRNQLLMEGSDAICLRSTFPCILQPISDLQMLWRIFVTTITLAVIIVHTYYIVFTQSRPISFEFFNFTVTVIYILDIFVHLSTGTKIEEGVPVTFLHTSSRQVRSPWFVMDVLAAVPMFELIGDGHFAGMNKLCKLPHVFRTIWLLEDTYVVCSSSLRLISFCLLTMVVTWLVAAFNHGFLCFSLNFCRIFSFLDSDAWEFNKTAKTDSEFADIIIYSNFWSVSFTTFTSHLTAVGSMVHFPTQAETMAILEVCALLHIFVKATYAATIMVTEQLSDKYEACIKTVQHFLKKNNINRALRERFINYLQLCWFTNKAYSITHKEKSILFDLPQHVYHDVITIQRNKYLMYIPFMTALPPEISKGISLMAHVFHTSPNEILLHTGDMCNEIYIIKQGFCEVINPDTKKVVSVITTKTHFGDIECLLRIPAFYTVRAVTHLELYSISRNNLTSAIATQKMKNAMRDVKKEPQYLELIVNRRKQFLTYEKPLPSPNHLKFPVPRKHQTDAEFLQPFQRLGFLSVLRYVFPRFTIHPDGKYLRRHECFRAVCAFVSAVLSPARFLLSMHYGNWFYNFTRLLDFTAYFDIVQRMLVGYYNEKGILVYHPASTAAHYIKGALLVDLLASLPLEYMDNITFYFSLNKDYKIVPMSMEILLFNRCLQLYRLPCAFRMLNKCVKRRDILYSIKMIPMFLVMISAVGTLIAIFSASKILYKRGGGILKVQESRFTSWIYYNATNVRYNITKTGYNLWLTTNYWATSQLTNTGLGIFIPHTTTLLIIFILGMLAAQVLLKPQSVRVISLRSNVNDNLALFKIHMKDMITFMKREKFSKDLQSEVHSYYNYTWSRTGGTDYNSVFKLCDQITLRTDAILHIYGQTFKMCPFLHDCDTSLLRLLGRAVLSVYCCEDMKVIERNDVISELYFVDYGTILVGDPADDDLIIATLSCGSIFGNLDNVDQAVCANSFIAGSNVHLLKIDARLFYVILKDFADVRENLAKYRLNDENYISSHEVFSKRDRSILNEVKMRTLAEYLHIHTFIIPLYLIVICLICIFLDVYNAGFQYNHSFIIAALYILDLAFVLKIMIYIGVPYITDPSIDSRYVSNRAKKRYLRGEFKCDVLSLLPFELLCLCFHKPWDWFSLFRLNRFLRLLTVHRCLKRWKELSTGMMTLTIINLAIWFALTIHTTTCIWYYLAEREDERIPQSSWRWNKMHGEKENTTTTVCYNSQYFCAMYFIIINLLRNGGVNDILPRQHIEVTFVCLLMILSTMICLIYVGEFCHVFHYHSWCCLNFYYKFLELQEFLKNNRVSRNLVEQTKKYSVYLWREARGRQVPQFVNNAPQCLRLKIMAAAYMKHLRKAHVFKNCQPAFLRQLVGHLQPYYYDENMYVVREGEITNAMYFMHKGRVRVLTEGIEEKGQVFKAGSYFGTVHGLYRDVAYTHSFKAEIKSQVLTLSLDRWEYLFRHFPVNIKYVYRDIGDPRTRDESQIENFGTTRMFPPKSLMKVEEKSNGTDQPTEPRDGGSSLNPKNESQNTLRLIKELEDKVRKSMHFDENLFKDTMKVRPRSLSEAETNKKVTGVASGLSPAAGALITKTQSQPTQHSPDAALIDSELENTQNTGTIVAKPQVKKLQITDSKVFFQQSPDSLEDEKDAADRIPGSKEKDIPANNSAKPKILFKDSDEKHKKTGLASVQPLADVDEEPNSKQIKHEPDVHDILRARNKREMPGSVNISDDTLPFNKDTILNEPERALLKPLVDNIPENGRGNKEVPKSDFDKSISVAQEMLPSREEKKVVPAQISSKADILPTDAHVIPRKKDFAFAQPVDANSPNTSLEKIIKPSFLRRKSTMLGIDTVAIKKELESIKNSVDVPSVPLQEEVRTTRSSLEEIELINISYNTEDDKKKLKKPEHGLKRDLIGKSSMSLFTLENRPDDSPVLTKKDQDRPTTSEIRTMDTSRQGAVPNETMSSTKHKTTNLKDTTELQDHLKKEQRSIRMTLPKSESTETANLEKDNLVVAKDANNESNEKKKSLKMTSSLYSVTDVEEYVEKKEQRKSKKKNKSKK